MTGADAEFGGHARVLEDASQSGGLEDMDGSDSERTAARPAVSVLVPAHNAAQTLSVTLGSLAQQTFDGWEAVVVDDGSSDETASIAEAAAAADPRIRVVHRQNGGVSAARNTAIEHARGDLIAFLDADDWLAPEAFELLVGELRARPDLDGVHCGWIRVTATGREVREICANTEEDLLSVHVRRCGFTIHAVVVRRAIVERAGGFDASLVTCEDWDFWMRLSRLGARWGRVDAHLAYYRMRTGSASMDAAALLRDGLVVIDRAPEAAAERGRIRLDLALYCAGVALGQGEDGLALVAPLLEPGRWRQLPPEEVAYGLLEGVPMGAASAPGDWSALGGEHVDAVTRFLDALERHTGAPALARRVKRTLQWLSVQRSGTLTPFPATDVATLRADLEQPLDDVAVDRDVQRLLVQARFGGLELPWMELPACDGAVGGAAIADAVAADHAWALLGEFLQATVYAPQAPPDLHDRVGWLVFLREAWGAPTASNASFYTAGHDGELAATADLPAVDGWVAFELADPPAQIRTDMPVRVCASVGGVAVDTWTAAPSDGLIRAGALRRELCTRAGFELCRIVVREALLGQPIAGEMTLRERLRAAATRRARAAGAMSGATGRPAGCALAPGWEGRARVALGDRPGHVIGRRRRGPIGSSASRPATLPRRAAESVLTGARAAGDPIVVLDRPGPQAPVTYAPDLLWDDRSPSARSAPREAPPEDATGAVTSELSILMYHHIAPTSSDEQRRWRLTPGELEAQLHHLRAAGYRGTTFDEWRAAVDARQPLPGRRVMLTFDDGYENFAEHAWPLLRQYGFAATVFVVTGLVGATNAWEGHQGDVFALMDWATIRTLHGDGVQFGGHSVSHPTLTALRLEQVVEEAASCGATLARELGHPAEAFAYPYGDVDPAIARMVGACGFEYGVTTGGWLAAAGESMLLLPRMEVAGTDSFDTFVSKLSR